MRGLLNTKSTVVILLRKQLCIYACSFVCCIFIKTYSLPLPWQRQAILRVFFWLSMQTSKVAVHEKWALKVEECRVTPIAACGLAIWIRISESACCSTRIIDVVQLLLMIQYPAQFTLTNHGHLSDGADTLCLLKIRGQKVDFTKSPVGP